MILANLDMDTLRTLVVANDNGGYAQAAARLGRTPSAVSLQMKRLQEDVGQALFRKKGRAVGLTEAGETVLRYARLMLAMNDELLNTLRGASLAGTIRIGFSQDFAENVLPKVLSRFAKIYPCVQMEVRIEGNAGLADAAEKGQMDLALTVGQAERAGAEVLGELELVWIAEHGFSMKPNQPLPLVVLGSQCSFRKQAIDALDRAGKAWRIAAVSPSLAGLWASASAGLGITTRSSLGVPANLHCGKELFGLPLLGKFPIALHGRHNQHEGAERMKVMIREEIMATFRSRGTAQRRPTKAR
jgi:DNA-binding transcriptional LysR family regulator